MVEKAGYKHEERGIWRGEKAWDGLQAHTVPTGCFSPEAGTEPRRPESLYYCSTAEQMCQTHGVSVRYTRCSSLLLLFTIFCRELPCRHEGLNAAACACFNTDTSPDVEDLLLEIPLK